MYLSSSTTRMQGPWGEGTEPEGRAGLSTAIPVSSVMRGREVVSISAYRGRTLFIPVTRQRNHCLRSPEETTIKRPFYPACPSSGVSVAPWRQAALTVIAKPGYSSHPHPVGLHGPRSLFFPGLLTH